MNLSTDHHLFWIAKMPEPTSSVTAVTAAISIPMITLAGISLGLRADLLVAGFFGALVAIILLNTVPDTGGDTFGHLIRTTLRRMFVSVASSVTAGYLAPLIALLAQLPDALLLGVAFAIGGGAQRVLIFSIRRLTGTPQDDKNVNSHR
jgi:hypothetical protein